LNKEEIKVEVNKLIFLELGMEYVDIKMWHLTLESNAMHVMNNEEWVGTTLVFQSHIC